MEPRTAQYIADATGGRLLGDGRCVALRLATDSRQARADDLFVALKGDRFDAHDFLPEVVGRGVSVILARDNAPMPELGKAAAVLVPDTRLALGRLAAKYRSEFSPRVIVVAGSNGKTTAKGIIASVLARKLAVTSSEASFNNDIGVPLSLLQINAAHQAAVFEAGTNHPGELAPLIRMICPHFGVITSIGREHLEYFGSIEGVAEEEGWTAELLPKDGVLFLNGDTPFAEVIGKRARAGSVPVGTGENCLWRVADVRAELRATVFNLHTADKAYCGGYRVPLLGLHQAVNAAFAVAIGAQMGLSKNEIQAGLAECQPEKMRLQFWEAQGVRVLDDCYNANADSMLAALRTLNAFPCSGRRVAVLGDMAELGAASASAHEEVGLFAAESGVGQLFAVGGMAAQLAKGARAGGLHRIIEFPEVDAAAGAVRSFVKPGDVVLVKASRAMRLERVSEALRGAEGPRRN